MANIKKEIRICRKCGSNDLYASGIMLCKNCSREAAKKSYYDRKAVGKERALFDYCSCCFEPKSPTKSGYCSNCTYIKARKVKYKDMSADFKIELYEFVKQIEQRGYNLYGLDIFYIMNYWCFISLTPHKYWKKTNAEQIKLMFDDLKEFLDDKNIKK